MNISMRRAEVNNEIINNGSGESKIKMRIPVPEVHIEKNNTYAGPRLNVLHNELISAATLKYSLE